MATFEIPKNSGKFTVVVALGGHFAVWNRKEGKHRVHIPVRTKKLAKEICEKLNRGDHDGTIEVLNG